MAWAQLAVYGLLPALLLVMGNRLWDRHTGSEALAGDRPADGERAPRCAWRASSLFFVVTTAMCLVRLRGPWVTWLDTGLYGQLVRRVYEGDWTALFHPHCSPVLLLFAPLGALPDRAVVPALMILQCAALSLAVGVILSHVQRHGRDSSYRHRED